MGTTSDGLQERVGALEAKLRDVESNLFTRASRETIARALDAQVQLFSAAQTPIVEQTAVCRDIAVLLLGAVEGTGCLTKSCTVEGNVTKMKLNRNGAVTEFEFTVTKAGCGLAVGAKFTYTAPPAGLHPDIKFWKRNNTKVSLTFDKDCKIETAEEL